MKCIDCQYHSPFSNRQRLDDESVHDIPVRLAEKTFKELRSMGTSSISFSGEGEPLLHSNIIDILSLSKQVGFFTTLNTNGTLLNDKIIDVLIKNRFDKIKIGIWVFTLDRSGNASVIDDNISEGLDALYLKKKAYHCDAPQVVLHCIINRRNFSELDTIVAAAERSHCNEVSFSPVWYWRNQGEITALSPIETSMVRIKLLILKKKLRRLSIKNNIDEVLFRYHIGETVWEKVPCYVSWFSARIRVNGMVFPCHRSTIPMGNLYRNSFNDIWNGSAFRSFRKTAMTRNGLRSIMHLNDCRFCCFVKDNHRIYEYLTTIKLDKFRKSSIH